MDQAIGIIGQAVLVLTGLVLMVLLIFLLLIVVRAIRRLVHELRQPRGRQLLDRWGRCLILQPQL